MRIAIATFAAKPSEFADDELLAASLRALRCEVTHVPWDRPGVDWHAFAAVVIRSTWDYAERRDEFVAWADHVGGRLHNSPAIVRWNSEKRYLGELAEAGFPAIETAYAPPGAAVPELRGEIVVKPTVSAGARDTGRFSPATHAEARELIASIHAQGKTAMVQPYVVSVDTAGETAVVCIAGEPAYALRKRAVLAPDEVAPLREDELRAAEAMYDPGLVTAGTATEVELRVARSILAHVAERFSYVPLYARVDLVARADGSPMLIELEAIEPNLYLDQVEGAAELLAAAIARSTAAAMRSATGG